MALDCPEPQVLVAFPDDDDFTWHHRILFRRLRDSQWIVLTPDEELQVEVLARHALLPLVRAGGVPAVAVGDCYMANPLIMPRFDQHHANAERLASILLPAGDGGRWPQKWGLAGA